MEQDRTHAEELSQQTPETNQGELQSEQQYDNANQNEEQQQEPKHINLDCGLMPEYKTANYTSLENIKETFAPLKNINNSSFAIPNPENAIFLKLSSSNKDNLHKAAKYGVWTSNKQNQVIEEAFQEQVKNPNIHIYIYFFINYKLFGMAELKSGYTHTKSFQLWTDAAKWFGLFELEWIFLGQVELSQEDKLLLQQQLKQSTKLDQENGLKLLNYAKQSEFSTVFSDFEDYDKKEEEMRQQRENRDSDYYRDFCEKHSHEEYRYSKSGFSFDKKKKYYHNQQYNNQYGNNQYKNYQGGYNNYNHQYYNQNYYQNNQYNNRKKFYNNNNNNNANNTNASNPQNNINTTNNNNNNAQHYNYHKINYQNMAQFQQQQLMQLQSLNLNPEQLKQFIESQPKFRFNMDKFNQGYKKPYKKNYYNTYPNQYRQQQNAQTGEQTAAESPAALETNTENPDQVQQQQQAQTGVEQGAQHQQGGYYKNYHHHQYKNNYNNHNGMNKNYYNKNHYNNNGQHNNYNNYNHHNGQNNHYNKYNNNNNNNYNKNYKQHNNQYRQNRQNPQSQGFQGNQNDFPNFDQVENQALQQQHQQQHLHQTDVQVVEQQLDALNVNQQ